MEENVSLARIAIIAALYAVITVVLQPISYGPIQVRVSECLTILPIFYWEAVPALFLGVFIANIFGGFGIYDIVFGSLLTFIAALLTRRFRKIVPVAFMFPVFVNGLGVPLYLAPLTNNPYWLLVGYITLGQAVAVWGLGSLLYGAISKRSTK